MNVTAADSHNPFAGEEISHTVPLTPEQNEIWLSVQLGGQDANLAYNETVALTLTGALDRPALRRALSLLVARHEALRCTLGGDGKQLCILREQHPELTIHDLTSLSDNERGVAIHTVERALITTPFDLAWGPLVRFALLALSVEQNVLYICAHHIICDGWSTGVILADLARLYADAKAEALSNATEPMAPPAQLTAYAREREADARSTEAADAYAYWQDQFRQIPVPTELPIDRAYPTLRRFDAARLDVEVPAATVDALRATASQLGTTFVALLHAAFQVYIHRLSSQPDVTIAVPIAGQLLTGSLSLVSHCVRTMPIRVAVDGARTFAQFALLSQSALLRASEHAHVTYSQIIERLPLSRTADRLPLTSVMFNVDAEASSEAFADLCLSVRSLPRAFDNFEWYVNATMQRNAMLLEWTYNTALFDGESIARRQAGFNALLQGIIANPTQRVMDLPIVPEDELHWMLVDVNATASSAPEETVIDAFLTHAGATPDAVAVRCGSQALTYRELCDASARMAERLRASGVHAEDRVGVFLNRSVDLLVALLGIMRAGAAYVPMDPRHPADRVRYIARDAELALCVTSIDLRDSLTDLAAIAVDDLPATNADLTFATPDSAFYLLYTSGSTGQPKGIVVEHRSVMNLLRAMQHVTGFSASSTMLAVTTPTFDISALELLLPLVCGGHLSIASDDEVADGRALAEVLDAAGITHVQATPSTYRMLIDADWRPSEALTVLVGGEALPATLAAQLRESAAAVWNCYGPTETTIWSTMDRVTDADIRIGRPLHNTRIYVLDTYGNPQPVGVPGELFIAGVGVARGYWRRPELTSARFIPEHGHADSRMYRTGDIVRLAADGRLEWLGRNDSQIKLRGHRIELGELESALTQIDGVTDAVAIVRLDHGSDDPRLVAYVCHTARCDVASIRSALQERLPRYMLPQHIVSLLSLPLTSNGKVDRKALPEPEGDVGRARRLAATETERRVSDEMARLLGAPPIGMDEDFFALGGHSLLALRLLASLRDLWAIDMPVRAFFANPTADGVSRFVDTALALRPVAVTTVNGMDEFLI
jgi:amino acid adenylation domain-containing protein